MILRLRDSRLPGMQTQFKMALRLESEGFNIEEETNLRLRSGSLMSNYKTGIGIEISGGAKKTLILSFDLVTKK